jgi:hypothetical protein
VRVHAVSPNVLLPRTLEAAMADAQVTTSTDPARVPDALSPDSVVVIDLETTVRGLTAVGDLRRRGVPCRIVVVGDQLPHQVPDDRTTFLVRPVPIGELRDAIDRPVDVEPATAIAPASATAELPADDRLPGATDPSVRRRRWRLEPRRASRHPSLDDLGSMIAGAIPACRDLIRALDEFPGLASVGVTAQAFVNDLLEALPHSRTAVTLVSTSGAHLEVAGFRGLTAAERLLRVPVAHPLVAESHQRSAPLVLEVPAALDLVAGVPGARAPALLVRSLSDPETVHGLVIVGASSFDDEEIAAAEDVIVHGSGAVMLASYIEQLASRGLSSSGQTSREVG